MGHHSVTNTSSEEEPAEAQNTTQSVNATSVNSQVSQQFHDLLSDRVFYTQSNFEVIRVQEQAEGIPWESIYPPQVVIIEYTAFGRLELGFDQLMLIPDLAEKLLIAYAKSNSNNEERRQLNTYGDRVGVQIDLEPYILFEVIRGDELTSAPIEDLAFKVYVVEFTD